MHRAAPRGIAKSWVVARGGVRRAHICKSLSKQRHGICCGVSVYLHLFIAVLFAHEQTNAVQQRHARHVVAAAYRLPRRVTLHSTLMRCRFVL